MRRQEWLAAGLAVVLLTACGGESVPPAEEGASAPGEPAEATAEQPAASPAPAAADTPVAGSRGGTGQPGSRMGGMMGGRMGGMPGQMMGGGSPEAAPRTAAAAATATGCPPIDQALVDRGRSVFAGAGNCQTCHGPDASGTALAPDLTDGEWLDTDGSYASIDSLVTVGVPSPRQHPAPMPAMGGGDLSAEQICAVSAYVYSLSH